MKFQVKFCFIVLTICLFCVKYSSTQQESSISLLSALQTRQQFNASQFAYNQFGPGSRVTGKSTGGESKRADISEMPILKGLGVSSIIFNMLPCSINLPHVHPRGTELFHVLEGNYITGVLEENTGRFIQNNLTKGMVTV